MNAYSNMPLMGLGLNMPEIDAAMESAAEEIATADVVDMEPETELARHARLHRRGLARFEARAAEALERGRTTAEIFKQCRKDLRAKFTADLAVLKAQEAQAKAETLSTIHTAERLAAAYRAALAELEQG